VCIFVIFKRYTSSLQIPDAKPGEKQIDAVIVDEEAIGSIDQPGCGAKILHGDGALDRYLSQSKAMTTKSCEFDSFVVWCLKIIMCLSVIFRAAKIIIIWKLWQALGDGAGSEVDGEAERAIGM
jgi:hypothetical protein